jgi:hypothetical protein
MVLALSFACTDTDKGADSGSAGSLTGTATGAATATGTATGTGTGSTTGGSTPAPVPEFGASPSFTLIGTSADDRLRTPRDLEFNPERPTELWTINRLTDTTVIFFDPGTPSQVSREVKDAFANHFMEEPSSIAFGEGGTFATCQESQNTYDDAYAPNDFMGPALWPHDLDVYAQVNQEPWSILGGSHADMLHQSPLCMGIAHVEGNAYFVFDGFSGNLVYYDFQVPHPYGADDHSDGLVYRWSEVALTRVEDVPGHLEIDDATGLLYVADTGTGRVLEVDTTSGRAGRNLPPYAEPLEEYREWQDAEFSVFADGLGEPSGVALHEGRVFISDHTTGEIIAYDADGTELDRVMTPEGAGIMGLTVGPEGQLWYVNASAGVVGRVDPG